MPSLVQNPNRTFIYVEQVCTRAAYALSCTLSVADGLGHTSSGVFPAMVDAAEARHAGVRGSLPACWPVSSRPVTTA